MRDLSFELNLARVLACTLVYESRLACGLAADARCDDQNAPTPNESTGETMQALIKYLPGFLQQQRIAQPKTEKAKVETAEEFSPRWSALQNELYKQFGPQLAETARAIDAANRLGGAQADTAVLEGPGRESFRAVQDMLKESDPEFFAIRQQAADQVGQLLGGDLTGAETEAIERKLARDRVQSGITTPTSTNTVAEAMKFGDAARNRKLQGVQAATSFLPSSRTGFDPTQVALGRPSINTGDSKFLGVTQPASAENSANNFFNQIAGFESQKLDINSQKRDWMDRVNEGVGSINVVFYLLATLFFV